MKIKDLYQKMKLDDQNWLLDHTSKNNADLFACLPLPSDLNQLEENILYICRLSDVRQITARRPLNFLCCTGYPFTEELNARPYNIICSSLGINELLTQAGLIFSQEQRLAANMRLLSEALSMNKGIQFLLDQTYELIKQPMILVDSNYRILAMNESLPKQRTDLQEQKRMGYMLESNIESMHKSKLYEKARELKYPHYSQEPTSNKGWLTALVYVSNIEVAQLGVLELNGTFSSHDYELIHYLCKLLSIELQKDYQVSQSRTMMHSLFLSELLEGNISSANIAKVRMKELDWHYTDSIQVMTVFYHNLGTFDRKAQFICEKLRTLFPGSHWVIYDEKIVFILFMNHNDFPSESELPDFYQYLALNHLIVAVSNIFAAITDTHIAYAQTLKAYSLAQQMDSRHSVIFYSDYMFHHMGELIAKNYPISYFYHPAVLELKYYDEDNKTNLLETLAKYLKHIDNPTAAAKELYIHKNTLFYRMNKIRELFHLNLNDGDERMIIQLTLKFLEMPTR